MNFEKKVIAIGLTTRRNPFQDSSIGDGGTGSLRKRGYRSNPTLSTTFHFMEIKDRYERWK